jgi:hypothetical protein
VFGVIYKRTYDSTSRGVALLPFVLAAGLLVLPLGMVGCSPTLARALRKRAETGGEKGGGKAQGGRAGVGGGDRGEAGGEAGGEGGGREGGVGGVAEKEGESEQNEMEDLAAAKAGRRRGQPGRARGEADASALQQRLLDADHLAQ